MYMLGIGKFLTNAKADAGMRTLSSAHAKVARIKGNGLKLSLYECTWLSGGSCQTIQYGVCMGRLV
jgi:hypothetical protein